MRRRSPFHGSTSSSSDVDGRSSTTEHSSDVENWFVAEPDANNQVCPSCTRMCGRAQEMLCLEARQAVRDEVYTIIGSYTQMYPECARCDNKATPIEEKCGQQGMVYLCGNPMFLAIKVLPVRVNTSCETNNCPGLPLFNYAGGRACVCAKHKRVRMLKVANQAYTPEETAELLHAARCQTWTRAMHAGVGPDIYASMNRLREIKLPGRDSSVWISYIAMEVLETACLAGTDGQDRMCLLASETARGGLFHSDMQVSNVMRRGKCDLLVDWDAGEVCVEAAKTDVWVRLATAVMCKILLIKASELFFQRAEPDSDDSDSDGSDGSYSDDSDDSDGSDSDDRNDFNGSDSDDRFKMTILAYESDEFGVRHASRIFISGFGSTAVLAPDKFHFFWPCFDAHESANLDGMQQAFQKMALVYSSQTRQPVFKSANEGSIYVEITKDGNLIVNEKKFRTVVGTREEFTARYPDLDLLDDLMHRDLVMANTDYFFHIVMEGLPDMPLEDQKSVALNYYDRDLVDHMEKMRSAATRKSMILAPTSILDCGLSLPAMSALYPSIQNKLVASRGLVCGKKREPVVLYYYPGFTGRVEGPMLLLEDSGNEYSMSTDLESPRAEPACFAPPFCKEGGVYMSQSLAICQHLGIKYGLAGPSDQQGIMMRACCNIEDFWSECYRPAKKGKDREGGAAFANSERFGKWMVALQGPLLTTGGGYLFGASPTFPDYHLLATCRSIRYMYPKAFVATVHTAGMAQFKAWYQRMLARPKIASFLASDRCPPALYEDVQGMA